MKFDFTKCNNARFMRAIFDASSHSLDCIDLYRAMIFPYPKEYKQEYIYTRKFFEPMFDFFGKRTLASDLQTKIDEKQELINSLVAQKLEMTFGSVQKYANELTKLNNDRSLLSEHSKTEEYKKLVNKIEYQKGLLQELHKKYEIANSDPTNYTDLEKLFFNNFINYYKNADNDTFMDNLVQIIDKEGKLYLHQNFKEPMNIYCIYNDKDEQQRNFVNDLKYDLNVEYNKLQSLKKNEKTK